MPQVTPIRCLVAGTAAWVASLLGAVLYIAPRGWAGAEDLGQMATWSLAFASVVALSAGLTPPRADAGALRTYLPIVVLGPGLGIGTFLVAVALLGGWSIAFPVFSCWAFGGLLGLLAPTLLDRGPDMVAGVIAAAALVALLWGHAVLRGLG